MADERLENFGFLFSHAALALRNMVGQKMRGLGLHRGQPPVLLTLEKHEGMSNSELAEFLDITPATLTNKVKRLEKAGLVIRKRDPDDERFIKMFLTEKGQGLMNQLKISLEEVERTLLKGFSEEEVIDLREKIMRMLENISEFDCNPEDPHHHRMGKH